METAGEVGWRAGKGWQKMKRSGILAGGIREGGCVSCPHFMALFTPPSNYCPVPASPPPSRPPLFHRQFYMSAPFVGGTTHSPLFLGSVKVVKSALSLTGHGFVSDGFHG
jgi:hypothetical protein